MDESGDEEETEGTAAGLDAGVDDGNESSSSDEESEKCPICLLKFRQQAQGRPDQCQHIFCLQCILEWAKVFK